MAWMATPKDAWANMADCGEFPCTAPLNALLKFENTVFEGENVPEYADTEFLNCSCLKSYILFIVERTPPHELSIHRLKN